MGHPSERVGAGWRRLQGKERGTSGEKNPKEAAILSSNRWAHFLISFQFQVAGTWVPSAFFSPMLLPTYTLHACPPPWMLIFSLSHGHLIALIWAEGPSSPDSGRSYSDNSVAL